MIKYPLWKKSDVFYHQAVLKLDWYSSKERFQMFDTPRYSQWISFCFNRHKNSPTKTSIFYRFYLPKFKQTYQAFYFKQNHIDNSQLDDQHCSKQLSKAKTKLFSSPVQIRFTESSNQFFYSQITPAAAAAQETNLTLCD